MQIFMFMTITPLMGQRMLPEHLVRLSGMNASREREM